MALSQHDAPQARRYAVVAVPVAPGDTLSQIAADNGVSLSSVEAANPGITNPNVIYVGQSVVVPVGGSFTQWSPASSPSASSSPSSSSQESSSPSITPGTSRWSSSGLGDIPGMPSSLASCIAFRESTDDTNPAADGNAYGIISASGYNVAGDSLAQQNQVAGELYAQYGGSPWSADGCPGT
jgi:LysM repeat protein